jgi:hypothetical protein
MTLKKPNPPATAADMK